MTVRSYATYWQGAVLACAMKSEWLELTYREE